MVNDCATNPYLGGEGVIDRLMSIARSMVISNNAQYTRVSTRTCQLIIAIASNSEAVYPYYLTSVLFLHELYNTKMNCTRAYILLLYNRLNILG